MSTGQGLLRRGSYFWIKLTLTFLLLQCNLVRDNCKLFHHFYSFLVDVKDGNEVEVEQCQDFRSYQFGCWKVVYGEEPFYDLKHWWNSDVIVFFICNNRSSSYKLNLWVVLAVVILVAWCRVAARGSINSENDMCKLIYSVDDYWLLCEL